MPAAPPGRLIGIPGAPPLVLLAILGRGARRQGPRVCRAAGQRIADTAEGAHAVRLPPQFSALALPLNFADSSCPTAPGPFGGSQLRRSDAGRGLAVHDR